MGFKYPKLEAINHWDEQILFLGTSHTQNTKRFENFHGFVKKEIKRTNGQNPTYDVIKIVRKLSQPIPDLADIISGGTSVCMT